MRNKLAIRIGAAAADFCDLLIGKPHLAARDAVSHYQADSVFRHGKRFALILAVSNDLRKRRHAHGEAAFVLWLKDYSERAIMIYDDIFHHLHTTLTFPASPSAHSSAARSHFAKSAAAA